MSPVLAQARSVRKAMFKDLWDHRLASGAERVKTLKAELGKVNQQVEQFLDRIADATVPSVIAAYETRIKALEDRKIVLAEKIATTGRPVRSFDETVRTAFDFLASPWQLWTSDRIEDKRTVLKLAFADRLAYTKKQGFRTPDFSLPFKALGHFEGQDFEMVRLAGIEPTTCPSPGEAPIVEPATHLLCPHPGPVGVPRVDERAGFARLNTQWPEIRWIGCNLILLSSGLRQAAGGTPVRTCTQVSTLMRRPD